MDFTERIHIRNYLLFAAIYGIIFAIQYLDLTLVVILIFLGLVVYSLLFPEKGVFYMILALFLFDDFPFDLSNEAFSSLHASRIGGQTIAKLFSLFFLLVIFLNWIKKSRIPRVHWIVRVFTLLFIVAGITGLLKGNGQYIQAFINDSRFFLNFIIGFYLVVSFLKDNLLFQKIFPYFAMIFSIKTIGIVLVSIYLSQNNTTNTIYSDSGLYLANFFVLFFIVVASLNKKKIWYSVFGILIILLCLGLSASRGKIVLTILSIFLFLFAAKKLKMLPLTVAVFIGVSFLVFLINPDMYQYLEWKLTSFKPDKTTGKSSYVRFVEYVNILGMSFNSIHSFIVGEGLGGYFTTKYLFFPFELRGIHSYPDEWINMGKFFKPHGSIAVMLLKNGVVGTMFFYGSLTYFFFKAKAVYFVNLLKDKQRAQFLMAFGASALPTLLISYSAKLNLMCGILFGVYYCLQLDMKTFSKESQLPNLKSVPE
jgi:hypothetical protein|tara:strand:+ start:738 stop:2177 length:1440 start_codon:yes stop_codon:yes gene_type:complete